MPKIRLEKPRHTDKQFLGKKWRPCAVCGPSWSETNDDTSETNFFGRHYPESQVTFREGKWYCTVHYRWRYKNIDTDASKIELTEDDREGPVKGTI